MTVASNDHFESLSHSERKDVLLNKLQLDKSGMYGIHWNIGTWIERESIYKYHDKL